MRVRAAPPAAVRVQALVLAPVAVLVLVPVVVLVAARAAAAAVEAGAAATNEDLEERAGRSGPFIFAAPQEIDYRHHGARLFA
jgi:hypothetical protein